MDLGEIALGMSSSHLQMGGSGIEEMKIPPWETWGYKRQRIKFALKLKRLVGLYLDIWAYITTIMPLSTLKGKG